MADEIRHERNIILQCVRYVVKNNFFDKDQNLPGNVLNVSSTENKLVNSESNILIEDKKVSSEDDILTEDKLESSEEDILTDKTNSEEDSDKDSEINEPDDGEINEQE